MAQRVFRLALGSVNPADRQVRGSDAPLPPELAPQTVIVAVALGWCVFMLFVNITMALFLWLRRRP